MADDSAQELKALLDAYEQRKQSEGAANTARLAEEQERREACADQLVKVARPVLETIVGQLTQAGHLASITGRTASYAYPSVELSFAPKSANAYNSIFASTLTFSCDAIKGVSVRTEIKTAQGSRPGSSVEQPPISPSAVTPEWVRSHALRFVDAVLRAN